MQRVDRIMNTVSCAVTEPRRMARLLHASSLKSLGPSSHRFRKIRQISRDFIDRIGGIIIIGIVINGKWLSFEKLHTVVSIMQMYI